MPNFGSKGPCLCLTLLRDFRGIFAQNNLDMGEISVNKHEIKLKPDVKSFIDHYRCIPLGMYEELHAHIQEMLEIRAIKPPQSLGGISVILVRKIDGKLRFCIDLRKLNDLTIKDACSIPQVQDTMDCLNRVV